MKQTPIYFDEIFDRLKQLVSARDYHPIFILVDENTHQHCLPYFLSEWETESAIEVIEIPAGEENKSLEIAYQVWESMVELDGSRNSLMINLGGGMVTDLGGFIASTFKRGIDFINIPTSLLAMVDASVGGKTGLDLGGIKNLIGSFAFPVATLIHPDFLDSLPEREFRAGLAEMLKHGLIYKKEHWQELCTIDQNESISVDELIYTSIQIKKEVVEQDPIEKGLRKILNFGHTVGHAVESKYLETDHQLLHGEAIAIGMMVEALMSFENELLNKEELDEIFYYITHFFGKSPIDENDIPHLIDWMKHDKKNQNGQIGFSLLDGIGHCKYGIYLNENQIREAILKYNIKLENY